MPVYVESVVVVVPDEEINHHIQLGSGRRGETCRGEKDERVKAEEEGVEKGGGKNKRGN